MSFEPSLYRRVLQDRQNLYNKAIAAGIYTPYIYPWDTLPILCLILGVILSPRLPGPLNLLSRYALTLSAFYYCIVRWPYPRTIGLTAGYGIGLATFWGLIMTVVLLVLHDPARDFRRIEVRRIQVDGAETTRPEKEFTETLQNDPSTVRRRLNVSNSQSLSTNGMGMTVKEFEGYTLVWQDYPKDTFLHLIDWSMDLMTSFRGINWDFRVFLKTYAIQPPEGDPPVLSEEARMQHKEALNHLRYTSIRNFLLYYLLVDFLKTTLVTEPYFLGIAPLDSPTSWPWLATLNTLLPGNIVTRFVRLTIIMGTTVSALTFIFSLSPLFFATVLPFFIGEDRLHAITKAPLLEVWMYPAQWGDMFTSLSELIIVIQLSIVFPPYKLVYTNTTSIPCSSIMPSQHPSSFRWI